MVSLASKNRIKIETGSCGPRDDPYGYQTLSVYLGDGTIHELRSCGLRGDRYVIWADGTELEVFDGSFDNEAYDEFTKNTGMTPCKWQKLYYERFYYEDPMGSLSQYI